MIKRTKETGACMCCVVCQPVSIRYLPLELISHCVESVESRCRQENRTKKQFSTTAVVCCRLVAKCRALNKSDQMDKQEREREREIEVYSGHTRNTFVYTTLHV